MSDEIKPRLFYKSMEEIPVAYIRFLGQHEEIPTYFKRLKSEAARFIVGDPICRYDSTPDDVPGAHYLEVCYPVSQPVEIGNVKSKTLPACKVMAASSPVAADAPWGPAAWWRELGGYVRSNYMTIDEDPLREIRYVENGIEMSEVQLALQFPRWIDGLSQGLKTYGDEAIRLRVMAGAATLEPVAPIESRLAWVQEAMETLDQSISDPQERGLIIQGCAHRFPEVRIEKMRALYKEELGSVDALIDWIIKDREANDGASWYGNPVREGSIVYDTKSPASPKEYETAGTDLERRIARCFCPIVRAAIRMDRKLSPTFCNCSAGYTAQFWESVLETPLRVDVVESVLQGNDVCKFAIHIPEHIKRS